MPLLFKMKVGNLSSMLCQTLRSNLPVDAHLELRGVASYWSGILLSRWQGFNLKALKMSSLPRAPAPTMGGAC